MSQTADARDVDELLGVVDRLSQEYATLPIGVVMNVVTACRVDLDGAPGGALPELVERLCSSPAGCRTPLARMLVEGCRTIPVQDARPIGTCNDPPAASAPSSSCTTSAARSTASAPPTAGAPIAVCV